MVIRLNMRNSNKRYFSENGSNNESTLALFFYYFPLILNDVINLSRGSLMNDYHLSKVDRQLMTEDSLLMIGCHLYFTDLGSVL